MLLSIVILNYKTPHLVRECIRSIKEQNFSYDYEIIVVDNNSQDGVKEVLRKNHPEVTFIQSSKNVGMGPGNNIGMRRATGAHIMILNPDGVVLGNSIGPLIDFLERHPQVGIAAPQILNPDRTHQVSVHKFPSLMMPFYRRTFLGSTQKGKKYLAEYVVDTIPQHEPAPVDWVFGPAFIIRRDVARKLSGYDERFFLFLEDTDLCRRVWEAGHEVWYVPTAQVIHFPHRLSAHHLGLWSLRKKTTWHHIASWLKYTWKWRNKKTLKH